jgi:hypothetical protein
MTASAFELQSSLITFFLKKLVGIWGGGGFEVIQFIQCTRNKQFKMVRRDSSQQPVMKLQNADVSIQLGHQFKVTFVLNVVCYKHFQLEASIPPLLGSRITLHECGM